MSTNKPKFQRLFSPITIGQMEIKNRIVMPPMTTDYGNEDQSVSQRLIDYLVERAQGGVGLITLEVCTIDIKHRYLQHSISLSEDHFIAQHKALVDAVHEHGAKIQPQITHPGPESLASFYEGMPAVGPSPVVSPIWGGVCRDLSVAEIKNIVDQYAMAAKRARTAGYDGIELHAAHSYNLLGSFLSPWRNKRTDEYAGNKIEGRTKFLLETIRAIKTTAGEDFPITLRLSGYERAPGARELHDTQIIAPMLAAAGVDAFHISGGVSDRLVSQIVASSASGDAFNISCASAIKQVVDIPVIAAGRIHTPELAERILQNNDADLVAMGRPLIADPELPKKAQSGSSDQIRRCLSCENCIDSMARGSLHCAINGSMGNEKQFRLSPTKHAKHVLIVGAGPAGLETARLCALQGHRVTILEKSFYLGGSLLLASTVHSDNEYFLDFLISQVNSLNIDIKFGITANKAIIQEHQPDKVVIACGAKLDTPTITGDHLPHVYTGEYVRQLITADPKVATTAQPAKNGIPFFTGSLINALAKPIQKSISPDLLRTASKVWMPFGKKVIIIGSDLACLELAEFLAIRKRQVIVVTSSDRLAPELGRKRRTEHLDKLDQLNVKVIADVKYISISKTGMTIESSHGHQSLIPADSIINAGDVIPNTALYESVKEVYPNSVAIGDSTGLGLIVKAVKEATETAFAI